VVIQEYTGYSLYVDGGASGWIDVIPFSHATPDVIDCIIVLFGEEEVVPKVRRYEKTYNIRTVKEAVIANRGDIRIYIIACVIGEEGVSGVNSKWVIDTRIYSVGVSRYRIGILGGR
jgi:hypothetical protein